MFSSLALTMCTEQDQLGFGELVSLRLMFIAAWFVSVKTVCGSKLFKFRSCGRPLPSTVEWTLEILMDYED